MIRYILKGGRVKSQHDGQIHSVASWKLVRLYGFDGRSDWILWDQHYEQKYPDAIVLGPREDGTYIEALRWHDSYQPSPPKFTTTEEADQWMRHRFENTPQPAD